MVRQRVASEERDRAVALLCNLLSLYLFLGLCLLIAALVIFVLNTSGAFK